MLQGVAEVGLNKNQNNELFEIVLQSVDRLNYVIQPMLNYLNTEQNYNFDTFNIEKVVNDIVVLCKANCYSRGISISVNNHLNFPYVFGDSKAIGQVLINLISNAMDAIQKDKGQITFKLKNNKFLCGQEEINGIQIDISDNGCGIEDSQVKKIFVPYESSKRKQNNVGLGLSIVSKIMKDHKGLIEIDSKVDIGTTVRLYFPKSKNTKLEHKKEVPFKLDDSFFMDLKK